MKSIAYIILLDLYQNYWQRNGKKKLPKDEEDMTGVELCIANRNKQKNKNAERSQIEATVLEWVHQLTVLPIISLPCTQRIEEWIVTRNQEYSIVKVPTAIRDYQYNHSHSITHLVLLILSFYFLLMLLIWFFHSFQSLPNRWTACSIGW